MNRPCPEAWFSGETPYSPCILFERQRSVFLVQSRPRKSAQDDKWSFCLTAGTLWPANQERPCNDERAGTTHRPSRRRWHSRPSRAIVHWLSLRSSSTSTPVRLHRGKRSLRKGHRMYSVPAAATEPRRRPST